MIFVPLNDKYVIAYNEKGQALVYIAYDQDNFSWNCSLSEELNGFYAGIYKRLDDFVNGFFTEDKVSNPRCFEASFIQKATDVLNIIKDTCPDWNKYKLPEFLLDQDGDLNMERLYFLRKMRRFDVRTALPYDGQEKRELVQMIPHLFQLVGDRKMWGDENIQLTEIGLREFESSLVSMELRFSWFESREKADKFFRFSDDSYELYFASDKRGTPFFIFFLPFMKKEGGIGDWDGSEAA